MIHRLHPVRYTDAQGDVPEGFPYKRCGESGHRQRQGQHQFKDSRNAVQQHYGRKRAEMGPYPS